MEHTAGLIGTGFIAAWHAEAYEDVPEIELAAVSDVDAEALASFGEEWDIPAERRYDSHEAMLEAEDLDLVSVTSPSFLHHDHVIDAVRSAADPDVIWCEKPIALSVSDARKMLAVCEEADTELVVNHMRRFSETYTELRNQIQHEEFLGDVESVHIQFGGELLRNGTHTVDLLAYLLGVEAESVSGYLTGEHGMGDEVEEAAPGEYDDCGGAGSVVLDDGTFVSLDHTTPRGHAENSFLLMGSDGKLRAPDAGGWEFWECVETDEGHGIKHVEADLPFDVTRKTERDNFVVGAEHVRDLLDGTAENRSPGSEAAHALEILVATFVSHHTGSRIDLPLADPLRDVEIFSW